MRRINTKVLWVIIFLMLSVFIGCATGRPKIPKENIPFDIPYDVRTKIEKLYSSNPVERATATNNLGRMSAEAEPAIPFLQGMLDDNAVIEVSDFPYYRTTVGQVVAEALERIQKGVAKASERKNLKEKILSAHPNLKDENIVNLIFSKKVGVKTQGAGISCINLQICRLVDKVDTVSIPVGTFFVSHSASVQSIVATQEIVAKFRNDKCVSVNVPVACADLGLKIPDRNDSFEILPFPPQKELESLMPVLQKAGVDFYVKQAAVWILTDDANYKDLGTLRTQWGARHINEIEVAQAIKIIDDAGLDITKKAIWKDLKRIVESLKDDKLKKWIQQKGGN